jgi:hypothetical protein
LSSRDFTIAPGKLTCSPSWFIIQQSFTEKQADELTLDYSRPVPPPSLRPADAQWIQERLHTWQEAKDATRP